MTFDDFCARAAHLRRAVVRGEPMPYKPLLLAAVVVLIHKGKITSRHILLDGGVKSAFRQLLRAVYPTWPFDGQPHYPYRHLETDGIWRLEPIPGAEARLATARAEHLESWEILRHVRCAAMDEEVFATLAASAEARFRLVRLLCTTYLPADAERKIFGVMGSAERASEPIEPPPATATLTERALEEHLERHWSDTPFAAMGVALAREDTHGFAGRQVLTPVNAIDLLGYQQPARCWWVIELKRGRPNDAVVGQISRYVGWLMQQRAGAGETAVGAIIAGQADDKLRHAVRPHPSISLWTYDEALRIERAAV
jgi:hypothetical protein